jgi:hypothetical protein
MEPYCWRVGRGGSGVRSPEDKPPEIKSHFVRLEEKQKIAGFGLLKSVDDLFARTLHETLSITQRMGRSGSTHRVSEGGSFAVSETKTERGETKDFGDENFSLLTIGAPLSSGPWSGVRLLWYVCGFPIHIGSICFFLPFFPFFLVAGWRFRTKPIVDLVGVWPHFSYVSIESRLLYRLRPFL